MKKTTKKSSKREKLTSKVKCQEPSYATNPIEILRCILHSTHLEKVLFTESLIFIDSCRLMRMTCRKRTWISSVSCVEKRLYILIAACENKAIFIRKMSVRISIVYLNRISSCLLSFGHFIRKLNCDASQWVSLRKPICQEKRWKNWEKNVRCYLISIYTTSEYRSCSFRGVFP